MWCLFCSTRHQEFSFNQAILHHRSTTNHCHLLTKVFRHTQCPSSQPWSLCVAQKGTHIICTAEIWILIYKPVLYIIMTREWTQVEPPYSKGSHEERPVNTVLKLPKKKNTWGSYLTPSCGRRSVSQQSFHCTVMNGALNSVVQWSLR